MAYIIDIKVVPSSGKKQCKLDKSDRLVCYLKSPPERGLANAELIKFIAKSLKIPQGMVTIIGGKTSRNKRLRIDLDITYEQFLYALGIDKQLRLF